MAIDEAGPVLPSGGRGPFCAFPAELSAWKAPACGMRATRSAHFAQRQPFKKAIVAAMVDLMQRNQQADRDIQLAGFVAGI